MFQKKFDWTAIQVKFRGSLFIGHGPDDEIIGEWRILFNNQICTDPGNIASLSYIYDKEFAHYKPSASKLFKICTSTSYTIAIKLLNTILAALSKLF